VLDIRGALEAHRTYSAHLDWAVEAGHGSTPQFQSVISQSLRSALCFQQVKKCGYCKEYRYCPELVPKATSGKAAAGAKAAGAKAAGSKAVGGK
jgi:hypothetical protein